MSKSAEKKKKQTTWALSDDVKAIVAELIQKLPEFKFIDPNDIACMFKDSSNSTWRAQVSKVRPSDYLLLSGTWLLKIAAWKDWWDGASKAHKYLAMFHELKHIKKAPDKSTDKYALRKHDIEDWHQILVNAGIDWENADWVFKYMDRPPEQEVSK